MFARSPYFQQRLTSSPSLRWRKSTSPSPRSFGAPPSFVISSSPRWSSPFSCSPRSFAVCQARRSSTPPPDAVIRCCSAWSRSRTVPAAVYAAITRSLMRVSRGLSAQTSPGEKYRSATTGPTHEDRVHFLGHVNPACQGELDVGRPARPRDEVDDGARAGRNPIAVPGLEEHADLVQRLDERCAIEERDVTG